MDARKIQGLETPMLAAKVLGSGDEFSKNGGRHPDGPGFCPNFVYK